MSPVPLRGLPRLLLGVWIAGGLGVSVAAQSYEISGEPGGATEVSEVAFFPSPDGAWVVYRDGVRDGPDRARVYSATVDGVESPRRLNTRLVAGGSIDGFEISADSRWVVYWGDQDTDEVRELYSARIDGRRRPNKLSPDLGLGGNVERVDIAPGSDWVLFFADAEVDEKYELYTAPIDGSAPAIRISPDMIAEGDARSRQDGLFAGANGSEFVLWADWEIDEKWEVFVVPVDGSRPAERRLAVLDDETSTGHAVLTDRLLIRVRSTDGDPDRGYFSVPIDGSTSPEWLTDGLDSDAFPCFSPDHRWMSFENEAADGRTNRYVVRTDGTESPVELQLPYTTHHAGGFSADSQWLMLRHENRAGEGRIRIFPSDGSAAGTRISGDLDVVQGPAEIPHSDLVVFRVGSPDDLYSAPRDASAPPTLLFDATDGLLGVSSLRIHPDGSQVIFRSSYDTLGREALYTVAPDGSAPAELLASGTDSIDVNGWELMPDWRTVVYDQQGFRDEDQTGLFAVAVDRSSPPTRISGPMVQFGAVLNSRISPDSAHVLYVADQRIDGFTELYGTTAIPGLGIGLDLEPEDPALGAALLFRSSGGVPGGVSLLFVTEIDGAFASFKLAVRAYDPEGVWTLSGAVPGDPIFSGMAFEFRAFAINGFDQVIQSNSQRMWVQ